MVLHRLVANPLPAPFLVLMRHRPPRRCSVCLLRLYYSFSWDYIVVELGWGPSSESLRQTLKEWLSSHDSRKKQRTWCWFYWLTFAFCIYVMLHIIFESRRCCSSCITLWWAVQTSLTKTFAWETLLSSLSDNYFGECLRYYCYPHWAIHIFERVHAPLIWMRDTETRLHVLCALLWKRENVIHTCHS